MPGCAGVGCVNSSKKGFLMKKFPKDPKRMKEWAIKTRRDKWVPTDSSVLCEAHFEPGMWERTREDGKQKLRADAVSSLFPFTKPQIKRRFPVQIKSDEPNIKISVLQDSTGVLNQDPIQGSSQDNSQDRQLDQSFEEASPQSSMEMISNTGSDTPSSHGERVLEKLSKILI